MPGEARVVLRALLQEGVAAFLRDPELPIDQRLIRAFDAWTGRFVGMMATAASDLASATGALTGRRDRSRPQRAQRGLDPRRACFFRQSQVPAVTELAWILSTLTPMGLLERSHSYKDKIQRGITASHGLFAYPVLMAADILIYDSDVVPVGKDQKQHIEVTRDLVLKFNETFGPTLKLPEPSISDATAVVPGLDGEKMSKSYGNTIGIFEEEASLRKKLMSLKTDSTPVEQPKPLEQSTILALYKLVATPSES